MRTPKELVDENYSRQSIGQPAKTPPRTPDARVVFLERSISVWGWPSRGGLIVLEMAGSVDFDHLGLNRLQPVELFRSTDHDEEDAFCQKLLQLGARWFDSHERYGFVANVAAECEPEIQAIENGEQPAPSGMEQRWVSVGLAEDGLWVLEYDRSMYHARETQNLVPPKVSRVMLAKTMQERCEILKDMGATFFQRPNNYTGLACLNAWKTKMSGEHGRLVKE